MTTTITITRYRTIAIPFAFLSMAIFHIPLFFSRKIKFYKLMGCGKNGTFDKTPDLHQWVILSNTNEKHSSNQSVESILMSIHPFIKQWLCLFGKETFIIILNPIAGHGKWDGKAAFGSLGGVLPETGRIATLTRASIRWNKLKYFWNHVAPISNKMPTAKGFVFSLGIGEVPWVKQSTFSIWESAADMKAFAYGMREHQEVIKKTKNEKWYSEDMFVRFTIEATYGQLHGGNPLSKKM